jgi:putative Holliday junction resolvase
MPGRVLALDLGEVRIGVALSDPLRVTARALTTLAHRDLQRDVDAIRGLVREHEVTEVVVGHPLHLGGERGRSARSAERFVERLGREIEVPVRLWDERWSTRAAQRTLLEMNVGRRRRGAAVDRMAAALILEAYLEFDRMSRGGRGRRERRDDESE